MLAYVQPSHLIRRAHSGEAALIGHLRRSALWCLDLPDRSPETIGAMLERIPDVDLGLIEMGTYFIAERAGEILGGAGWSPLTGHIRAGLFGDDDRLPSRAVADAVLVRGLFIDSEESRFIVAVRLMAHLETDAARAGYGSAEIVVPAGLQSYCRDLGFRAVGRLSFAYAGETVPLVHMRRRFVTALRAVA